MPKSPKKKHPAGDEYTIKDLDADLMDLNDMMVISNLSIEDRIKLIDPLKSNVGSKLFSEISMLIIFFALFVLVVYFVTLQCVEKFSWHITAFGRIAMIQILRFYDWTLLKDQVCLIPKYPQRNLSEKTEIVFDCNLCETLRSSDEFVQLNSNKDQIEYNQFIASMLLELDNPILVNAEFDNGIALYPGDFILRLFQHKEFAESIPCNLCTNFHNSRREDINSYDLFQKQELFDSFFIHFQNCEVEAMKIFRSFTFKPDTLPEVMAPVTHNWLIWNRNYNAPKYKKINLVEKYTLIGQMIGETPIKLIPRNNCAETCSVLNYTLPAGQMLLFTNLWDLEYLPRGNTDNMAVIMEIGG